MKKFRIVGYADGRVVLEVSCDNWAQVGGHIGNAIDDLESLAVFRDGQRVMFYHTDGIY